MPHYHFETYLPRLQASDITIAARKWILHDNHWVIVDQLRDLVRMNIRFRFVHNLPPNSWNNKVLSEFSEIPNMSVIRVSDHDDFYGASIDISSNEGALRRKNEGLWNKLVFLENDHLTDEGGKRVNLLLADNVATGQHRDVIENTNLRIALVLMSNAVQEGRVDRIHIIRAARKNALKDELFTLEWSGTLIDSNFVPDVWNAKETDQDTLFRLLEYHKHSGQLKPRDRAYIAEHFHRFLVAGVDGIPVGCVEVIPIDSNTIELAGIAVNAHFMDFRIWKKLVESVEEYAYLYSKNVISVTWNSRFAWMLESRGYIRGEQIFPERAAASPKKRLFYKRID